MSPESMKHAVQKVLDCNNDNVMVTDRGTMFGYDMIVDFRGPYYAAVCKYGSGCNTFIATTDQTAGVTGGRPDMIETIPKQELQ
jgi:2-dehydro-3-deoxyphosphooctonate aldolase (KDO 8-P synthase)